MTKKAVLVNLPEMFNNQGLPDYEAMRKQAKRLMYKQAHLARLIGVQPAVLSQFFNYGDTLPGRGDALKKLVKILENGENPDA